MFGLLKTDRSTPACQASYARLCQHHRLVNGLSALPVHSYEAAFLFQVAADMNLVNGGCFPQTGCCRLKHLPADLPANESLAGAFCAHFAMLLVETKLVDDIQDDGSVRAKCARWLWKRPMVAARAFFRGLDAGFEATMATCFEQQRAMEQQMPGAVSWQSAVRPTRAAFGHVFGLLPHHLGRPDLRPWFTTLGEEVGAGIVSFDMALDWQQDRRSGAFNPLASERDVEDCFIYSAGCFAAAAGTISAQCPESAGSVRQLNQMSARVRHIIDVTSGRTSLSPQSTCASDMPFSFESWREGRLYAADPCGAIIGCFVLLACVGCAQRACGNDTTSEPAGGGSCDRWERQTGYCGEVEYTRKGPCDC